MKFNLIELLIILLITTIVITGIVEIGLNLNQRYLILNNTKKEHIKTGTNIKSLIENKKKKNAIQKKSIAHKNSDISKSNKDNHPTQNNYSITASTSSNNEKSIKYNHTYENFHLSFYTSLSAENSNSGTGVDCHSNPLVYGTVADNQLPYGTKIYIKGWGIFTVRDRGSSKYFSNKNELDVFIPREQGETNEEYYNRVNNMGRVVSKGYLINNK